MSIKFYFEKYRSSGPVVFMSVVLGIIVLSYILLHNPYKILQSDIFNVAEKVHNYYREQPGYWKLSTQSAKDDGLMKDLSKYKNYDIQVGQGLTGEAGLPSDSSFNIVAKNLTKSACVSLSELSIPDNIRLILEKITIINDKNSVDFVWGGEYALPIGRQVTRDLCVSQQNTVVWTFR